MNQLQVYGKLLRGIKPATQRKNILENFILGEGKNTSYHHSSKLTIPEKSQWFRISNRINCLTFSALIYSNRLSCAPTTFSMTLLANEHLKSFQWQQVLLWREFNSHIKTNAPCLNFYRWYLTIKSDFNEMGQTCCYVFLSFQFLFEIHWSYL